MNSYSITTEQKLLCEFCANVLFNKEIVSPPSFDADELINEAKHQAVFPIVYQILKELSVENESAEALFFQYIAKNIRVNNSHTEIGKILKENNIEYIIIKGIASANYYKEPILRTMGDVDILIHPKDIERVNYLLNQIGYKTNQNIFEHEKHISFAHDNKISHSVCEVHFKVNGIPNTLSDVFGRYFEDIFKNSREIEINNVKYPIPSDFHHGIILLLHTADHLTNEGIGLRHFCDWAVFVDKFNDSDFVNTFKKPLKEMGMWKFAQILTQFCQKFLNVGEKAWVGKTNDALLNSMLADIINSGNFAFKNKARYGQIKYIKDFEAKTVENKCSFSQLLSNINAKAKNEYPFIKKSKILLPIGWLAIVFNYFFLVLSHKRKLDSIETISHAKHRKSIYNEFKLFEIE